MKDKLRAVRGIARWTGYAVADAAYLAYWILRS